MNREQKRKMEKRVRKAGASKEEAQRYVSVVDAFNAISANGAGTPTTAQEFAEGDKVRINVDFVKSRKNYCRMLDDYKEFVENSAGRIFTAHVEHKNLISFAEAPRWLFWSGDLEKVYADQTE